MADYNLRVHEYVAAEGANVWQVERVPCKEITSKKRFGTRPLKPT